MIDRPSRARVTVATVSSAALVAGLCLVTAGPAQAITTHWSYGTPGHYTWTVPTDVHEVQASVWGAYGGGSNPHRGDGGVAAFVQADLEVVPGDTLDIYVGGAGADASDVAQIYAGGFNGGGDGGDVGVNGSGAGGGGASDIRFGGTALIDRVIVAAGGGGTASTPGGSASAATGGSAPDYASVLGGGGATVLAGGAGAAGSGPGASAGAGTDGVLGQGGDGQYDASCRYTAGGGGGGLYGGGGGGCESNAGGSGGGAGSSLVPAGGVVELSGGSPDEDFDGYVSLNLIAPSATSAPTAVAGDGQATVSWSAASDPGSMNISGYSVVSFPDGRTCSTTTAVSCVVTGLTNGTAYTFSVVTNSPAGDSDESAASEPVTPHAGPTTVAPTVVFPARGAFVSRWTVVRSGGSPAATMATSTPSVCRVSGPSVVFLRVAGTCRLAVTQDGSVVARAAIPVAVSGSGTALTTGLIGFRSGSVYLSTAAKQRLRAWAPTLRGAIVVVTGWSSGTRTTAADRAMSAQRARVIATYLASFGVRVTARYGAGSHWVGSSTRSRDAQVSWYATPRPV